MSSAIPNHTKECLSSSGVTEAVRKDVGGFHKLQAVDLDGNNVDFSVYKGNVAVVINVASKWGITASSYEALNKLYSKHSTEGLRILGFPSREFAEEEFAEPKDIQEFVASKGVEFDVYGLISVNGHKRHPVYQYLMGVTSKTNVPWNFATAFIVGRDGSVRARIDQPRAEDWATVERLVDVCLQESLPSSELKSEDD